MALCYFGNTTILVNGDFEPKVQKSGFLQVGLPNLRHRGSQAPARGAMVGW
jgi:hypothetical protein